jgi:hypothetical protein
MLILSPAILELILKTLKFFDLAEALKRAALPLSSVPSVTQDKRDAVYAARSGQYKPSIPRPRALHPYRQGPLRSSTVSMGLNTI